MTRGTSPATREKYLTFGVPCIGEEEIAEVVDSLRNGWIGTGPKVARFEALVRRGERVKMGLIPRWLRRLLRRPEPGFAGGIPYWEERARKHGVRSVLNIRHTPEEVEAETRRQKEILFPLLAAELRPEDRTLLDFGSGPGRFSPGLAELTGGRVVGVDPIRHLLELAPAHPRVEYRCMPEGGIPLEDASVDVVWSCLVLTTITGSAVLRATVAEVERVLRPGGLLFVVENTSRGKNRPHLRFRPEEEYLRMFPAVPLRRVGEYQDLGERISVMAGRKGGA